MANICSHCEFKITSRNQLCEDYRDPEKAYGCPQCVVHFIFCQAAVGLHSSSGCGI